LANIFTALELKSAFPLRIMKISGPGSSGPLRKERGLYCVDDDDDDDDSDDRAFYTLGKVFFCMCPF
jgi:hypothetical protein